MCGPVVGSVVRSWAPVGSKLALGITAAKPMESHVHRFSAAWLDVVGDDTMRCAVVGLDGCGRLLVAHLFEEVLHGDCFTGVDVEGSKFGFSRTGHNSLENFGYVKDDHKRQKSITWAPTAVCMGSIQSAPTTTAPTAPQRCPSTTAPPLGTTALAATRIGQTPGEWQLSNKIIPRGRYGAHNLSVSCRPY
jgi:hypothetical protein